MPDPARSPTPSTASRRSSKALLAKTGFTRSGLFMQDYGGPVGFRILDRRPEWLEWLILQKPTPTKRASRRRGTASAMRCGRTAHPRPRALLPFLELDGIKLVYLHGHRDPELISPDNWHMDFRFMERPNARRVQLDLFYDYRTNVALYPSGRRSCASGSRRRSSSGAERHLLHARGRRGVSAGSPQAEMIASTRVTSRSRTASTRSRGRSLRFHAERVAAARAMLGSSAA